MSKDIEFECPHCGRKARTIGDLCEVLHEEPVCQKFNELDPLEFLMSVNDVLAAKMGTTDELARIRKHN